MILQGRYKCGYLRIGDMSSTISLPVCSCCNRHIMPNDKCVKFNCPNCGSVLVWRCQSCREAARNYTCESCSFTGP